jgi:hypothetical protein
MWHFLRPGESRALADEEGMRQLSKIKRLGPNEVWEICGPWLGIKQKCETWSF